MKRKPRGWFTRTVRGILEPLWDKEYMMLGKVDRWECRTQGWEEVKETVGIGVIEQLAKERYQMAESQVLESNQSAFAKKVREARMQLLSQGTLALDLSNPSQAVINAIDFEVGSRLHTIRDLILRKPGPDKDFSELIQVRDINFDVIYDMVVVRDDNTQKVLFSKADYDFLDIARRAKNARTNETLGNVFRLDDSRLEETG